MCTDCALDDIRQILDKFRNIMNDIAILDCSFLDVELFIPVSCATALIEIHIGQPFLSLLLNTETNYDTLLDAFLKLHQNLTDIEISKYLQFESVVCVFVSQDHFKKLLPKSCLLESLTGCISQYKKEVQHFLSICIPRLAEGFELQQGAIFGFGKFADDETNKVLKLSTLESSKCLKLNQAPVCSLNEDKYWLGES